MNISIGSQAIATKADDIISTLDILKEQMHGIKIVAQNMLENTLSSSASPFIMEITIFILACFVGYYVVWNVTPALHSPLMSVTNAISSVIIIGALIALGTAKPFGWSSSFAFIAIVLATVNIVGGFIVTQRMLQMLKKKKQR